MELIRDHYNDCTEKEKNTEGQGKENSGAEQKTDSAGFRDVLGIRIVERGEGFARGEMEVKEWHLNPLGIIHGGCLFSLADTVSGTAIMGHGHRVTTVNGSINFLRPGKPDGKMTAEAREVKYGRTFSVCDCQIFDDREKLVATTTMTFYHLVDRKIDQGEQQKDSRDK